MVSVVIVLARRLPPIDAPSTGNLGEECRPILLYGAPGAKDARDGGEAWPSRQACLNWECSRLLQNADGRVSSGDGAGAARTLQDGKSLCAENWSTAPEFVRVQTAISASQQRDRLARLEGNARALLSEYADNEIRADAKFRNQNVELVGFVQATIRDKSGRICVAIATDQNDASIALLIQCRFSDRHGSWVARLARGDSVQVRGTVEGLNGNAVVVHDCEPNPF
jgi:hypothetical protein